MSRKTGLWITGVASLVLLVALAIIDGRLQDTGGPGIIEYEFAGNREEAREMFADWGDDGRDKARLSLWLDYPYLVAYGLFVYLAVGAIRDHARRAGWARFAAVGGVLVFFPLVAALMDAIEDVGLLLALEDHGGDGALVLAFVCAAIKFASILPALLYVLVGLLRRLFARTTAPAQ